MKSLQEMALRAVPNPGFMARTYLVPWHPLAVKLEARRQYEEDRNKFREQHRTQFRCGVREFRFIERWYDDRRIYPSNVMFLDGFWMRCFGSKIVNG